MVDRIESTVDRVESTVDRFELLATQNSTVTATRAQGSGIRGARNLPYWYSTCGMRRYDSKVQLKCHLRF